MDKAKNTKTLSVLSSYADRNSMHGRPSARLGSTRRSGNLPRKKNEKLGRRLDPSSSDSKSADPMKEVFHSRWLVYSKSTLEEGMAFAFIQYCNSGKDELLSLKIPFVRKIQANWNGNFEELRETLEYCFNTIGLNDKKETRQGVLMFEALISVLREQKNAQPFEKFYWAEFEAVNYSDNLSARNEMKNEVVPLSILKENVSPLDLISEMNLDDKTAERILGISAFKLLWIEEIDQSIESLITDDDISTISQLDLRESRAIYSLLTFDESNGEGIHQQYRELLRAHLHSLLKLQEKGKLITAKIIHPDYKCQNLWEGSRELEQYLNKLPDMTTTIADIRENCKFESRYLYEIIKYALQRQSISLDCSLKEVDLGRNTLVRVTLHSKRTSSPQKIVLDI